MQVTLFKVTQRVLINYYQFQQTLDIGEMMKSSKHADSQWGQQRRNNTRKQLMSNGNMK